MYLIKIIAPIFVIMLTLVQYYLDHKYRDRRTKKYKITKNVFLIFVISSLILTSVTTYFDMLDSNELKNEVKSLRVTSKTSDSLDVVREVGAKTERRILLKEVEELNTKLKPFLDLAITKYPTLKPNEALDKLQNDLKNLKVKTDILQEKADYIESRTTYHPIEKSLENNIINELQHIYKTFPNLNFTIFVENGSILRQKIAEELKEILNKGGYKNVVINSRMSFSHGVLPNLLIRLNKGDEKLVNLVIKPFADNFFTQIPNGTFDANIERYNITVELNGEPIIERNGKISFQ